MCLMLSQPVHKPHGSSVITGHEYIAVLRHVDDYVFLVDAHGGQQFVLYLLRSLTLLRIGIRHGGAIVGRAAAEICFEHQLRAVNVFLTILLLFHCRSV